MRSLNACYSFQPKRFYPGEIIVIADEKQALDELYRLRMRSYVIATYTALAPVRALMRKDERDAA